MCCLFEDNRCYTVNILLLFFLLETAEEEIVVFHARLGWVPGGASSCEPDAVLALDLKKSPVNAALHILNAPTGLVSAKKKLNKCVFLSALPSLLDMSLLHWYSGQDLNVCGCKPIGEEGPDLIPNRVLGWLLIFVNVVSIIKDCNGAHFGRFPVYGVVP